MKDRTEPCIHYTNAHGECRKGYKDVTLKKCKNCTRYHARKAAHRKEPVSYRRRKDRERHGQWD